MDYAARVKEILVIYEDVVADKIKRGCGDGGLKTDHLIKLTQVYATMAVVDALKQLKHNDVAEKLLE